jgi:hypothetical protein
MKTVLSKTAKTILNEKLGKYTRKTNSLIMTSPE